MAALFLRLLYSIFPEVDWQFVYVDDFLWLLRRDTSELLATAILATLTAMGMPLAWHKTAMMETNTWLGFVINTPKAMPSLPAKKYLEISELLQKVEEGRSFLKNDLVSLLGRLQWAVSAAPYCRPLLQPFWSWLKARYAGQIHSEADPPSTGETVSFKLPLPELGPSVGSIRRISRSGYGTSSDWRLVFIRPRTKERPRMVVYGIVV